MFWLIVFVVAPAVFAVVAMATRSGGGYGLAPPPPNTQWAKDPTGRHELRLWDGSQWTGNVSDSGRSGWDPLP